MMYSKGVLRNREVMVAKVQSLGYRGLEVYSVAVEVDTQRGLPAVSLIGLADTALKESKERVRSSLKNSGFKFPAQRITINLAPARFKKEGTHFDLAIALGLIIASGQARLDTEGYILLGELSLEGEVKGVSGVFPMAMEAKKQGKKILVPTENAYEAGLVKGLDVYPVRSLSEAVAFLSREIEISPFSVSWEEMLKGYSADDGDFSEVKGQRGAKRALEIAAAGMHNILLLGPPGAGKTMLARRLPPILPDMVEEEMLEVTKIYSIAGLLHRGMPLVRNRPFRTPHHTSSNIALVGGGSNIRPGEITLAHKGVLFLDELAEFRRDALEALRQPLEDGEVSISRARRQLTFPCQYLLVGAMNPCPCGYFGSQEKSCHCTSYQIQKYRNKISGPLLDRIDMHVELSEVKTDELLAPGGEDEPSSQIKQRVERARLIQQERFAREKVFFNAQMSHKKIRTFCPLSAEAKTMLKMAMSHFSFSARAYDKILKVARTIADLEGRKVISPEDISEAVQYRSLDKHLWV